MDEARKKSIMDAMTKYYERNNPNKEKRHNTKPEKEVEKEVVLWMKMMGWKYTVIESKAVYSQAMGRYMHSQAKKGHADITGITDCAVGFAVELKAPGKRSTLREDQRIFLVDYISRGGFACVTDSVSHLENLYKKWTVNRDSSLLLNDLPVIKAKDDKPLFD